MRRVCLLALVLGCGLALAAPAYALPHLGKWRSQQVSSLVTRFVNDMVLRRDLADGWRISGPAERGSLTRKQWLSGRQLPVQQFNVLNNPATAWYAKWRTKTEIGLVVSLRTGHGKDAEMLQVESVLQKIHGRWVVGSFYVDGIFRLGRGHSGSCVGSDCKVTGLADYAPGGGGGVISVKPRIGHHVFIAILAGIGGIVLLTVLGAVLHVRRRDRRLRAAYNATR